MLSYETGHTAAHGVVIAGKVPHERVTHVADNRFRFLPVEPPHWPATFDMLKTHHVTALRLPDDDLNLGRNSDALTPGGFTQALNARPEVACPKMP